MSAVGICYNGAVRGNYNLLSQRLRRRSDVPKHPHSPLVSPLENKLKKTLD